VAGLTITVNEPITGLLGPNRKAVFMGVKVAVTWEGKSIVPHDKDFGNGRRGIIYGFEYHDEAEKHAKLIAAGAPVKNVKLEYV